MWFAAIPSFQKMFVKARQYQALPKSNFETLPSAQTVMVKREDEQAVAELNAANPIFVEDAARLFAEQMQNTPWIGDFRVVASHQESLHSHDAVSVLTEGATFDQPHLDPRLFASLIHQG